MYAILIKLPLHVFRIFVPSREKYTYFENIRLFPEVRRNPERVDEATTRTPAGTTAASTTGRTGDIPLPPGLWHITHFTNSLPTLVLAHPFCQTLLPGLRGRYFVSCVIFRPSSSCLINLLDIVGVFSCPAISVLKFLISIYIKC